MEEFGHEVVPPTAIKNKQKHVYRLKKINTDRHKNVDIQAEL